MQLLLAKTDQQIEECFDVIKILRPQLTQDQFINSVAMQRGRGYQLLMACAESRVEGVAGFVVGHKLAWGKHIYIDDLVTAEMKRSRGVGKCLVDWLIDYAKREACESIHLDSGVQRFAAHKFYLRENFSIASHHFSLRL